MNPVPAIDKEAALARIAAMPDKMLSLDEAYFALYGEWRSGGRIRVARRFLYLKLIDPIRDLVLYEIPDRLLRLFGSSLYPQIPTIAVEDSQKIPGCENAKSGQILVSASTIELYLRRCRRIEYVPELGIETPYFLMGESMRFACGDIAGFLLGKPPIQYEPGSENLHNSCKPPANHIPA